MSNVRKRMLLRRRKTLLMSIKENTGWTRIRVLIWWETRKAIFGGFSPQDMWLDGQHSKVEKIVEGMNHYSDA